MKALIMAGGLGSRAKPFTDFSPKPLLPIFDRPMIDYIVKYLSKFKVIDEILIVANLDPGKGKQIQNYFEGKDGTMNKKLIFVNDQNYGTGGAILDAERHLTGDDTFLVWFSDNLAPIDISNMLKFHKKKKAIATVAVSSFKRQETGSVRVDRDCRVEEFLEKPVIKIQNPESLGIYVFDKTFLRFLRKVSSRRQQINLSYDALSKLPKNGTFYAYDIGNTPWIDVESQVKIERNTSLVEEILSKMGVTS
ncbi:MAG: nucleotidyltransferase family protein [Thaumarchaeota archaeon]|nr:nucleotidyltransferase family protein [Nitrososphaerota archaeon]